MDIASLKRDSAAIEAGQWIDDIPGADDLSLRVRGLSSPVVTALLSKRRRKVSRADRLADGTIKPAIELAIFCNVLLEVVLLDWKGMTRNKVDVPYDRELARELLTTPDFRPFADAVTYAAQIVDLGVAAAQDGLEKNSQKPSGGRSNTAPSSAG